MILEVEAPRTSLQAARKPVRCQADLTMLETWSVLAAWNFPPDRRAYNRGWTWMPSSAIVDVAKRLVSEDLLRKSRITQCEQTSLGDVQNTSTHVENHLFVLFLRPEPGLSSFGQK